jgi:hypothetical protein
MNQCTPYLPGGINKDCAIPLALVDKVFFCSKALEFTSIADALSISSWKAKIQTDLSVYVIGGMYDYEPSTKDPNIQELSSTQKLITDQPIPSAKIFLATNFCDYQETLRTLKGGMYSVIYLLRDGTFLARKNAAGKIYGFTASLTAITKGLPGKDLSQNHPVWINHTSYKEFEAAVLLGPEWDMSTELIQYMPIGLNIMTMSTVTAGVVSVQVNLRCGAGFAGLLIADFEVLDSSGLTTPIVGVLVDNTLGSYTITLQKGAVPAAIAAGDWMTIRVKRVAATIVSYISNRLYIQA